MDVKVFHEYLQDLYLDAYQPINIPAATLQPGEKLTVPYNSTVSATGSIDPSVFAEFLYQFGLGIQVGVAAFPPFIGDCNFPDPVECIIEEDPIVNVTTFGSFTYTYDPVGNPGPVPEPGTLALLGLGLAGIRLSRRRTPD